MTQEKRTKSATQAARSLEIAPGTMLRLCRSGEIAAVRIGKVWRVSEDEIAHVLTHGTRPRREAP